MPSRKQRRRRQKLQRHEYEYVLETEEGEEIPLKSPRPRPARQDGGREQGRPVGRGGRPIPEPSMQRVFKRALIFAPLLFIVVFLTAPPGEPVQTKILRTAVLLAFFIPFSYLVDVAVYRLLMRRHRRQG